MAAPVREWKVRLEEGIRRCDVFPKYAREARIKDRKSRYISLIVVLCGVLLFLQELNYFLAPRQETQIVVDVAHARTDVDSALSKESESTIPVFFNLTIPGMKCDMFGVDFVDNSGQQLLEFNQTILKVPLDSGGCICHGYNHVKRVGGEFHLAFGRLAYVAKHNHNNDIAHEEPKGHNHRFTQEERRSFNQSHTINHLMFGQSYPGRDKQPLDGISFTVKEKAARSIYYLTVVPTEYVPLEGREIKSYQLAFSVLNRPTDPMASRFKQPGIYFKYEFSPYLVRYVQKRGNLLEFVTRLCAVIGGVAGVTTLILRFLREAAVPLSKKME